jgi:hypothetical protein
MFQSGNHAPAREIEVIAKQQVRTRIFIGNSFYGSSTFRIYGTIERAAYPNAVDARQKAARLGAFLCGSSLSAY